MNVSELCLRNVSARRFLLKWAKMYGAYTIYLQISQALQIPSSESAKNHDISPGSLRRSNSSPSILSGSLETLSPRDNISDIVQFGLTGKPDKPTSPTKAADTAVVEAHVEGGTQIPAGTQVNKLNSDTSRLVPKPDKVAEVKFQSEKLHSVPKEYTSLLTKQLSPSPDSSETSSLHDEVGELPVTLRRQRGHTIAAIQQTGILPTGQGNQDVGSARSGKDSKVGVSPSFVFLQLYHSGQLPVSDVPLLLPNNEVSSFHK